MRVRVAGVVVWCGAMIASLCVTSMARALQDSVGDAADRAKLLERIAELESRSTQRDARNAELESRLAAIEAEQRDERLSQQRADEIRALVLDVLADADTRASMMQAMMSGYDDGFFLSSADGNWLLRTNMLMQQRLVINRQEESLTDKSKWGFENSRTRLTLSGHLISPDWFYRTEIELANNNTGYPTGESRTGLLDAYIGYDFGQGWKFWVGTFKTPLLREELVDSSRQMLVERSLVNAVFTGGRTDGLGVEYRNDRFGFVGSYNNGINDMFYGGGVMTGGTSGVFGSPATFAMTARGEWLLDGTWDAMEGFSSPRGEAKSMMLGGAMHVQLADSSTTGVANVDLIVMTVDFTAKFGGTSVFAAIMYADASADAPAIDGNAVGFVIQAGHYIREKWEVFARYEWADVDDFAGEDISILTLGFNKYLSTLNAIWTTDVGFALDPVPVSSQITGWRMDLPDNDGQFVVRSQLQISF